MVNTMKKPTIFFLFIILLSTVFTGCGNNTVSSVIFLTGCGKSNSSPAPDAPDGTGSPASNGTSTQKGSRGSTLCVLTCSADGTSVTENESAIIDYSNGSEGYVQVNYIGSSQKVKLQITTPEDTTYTYSLHSGYEAFPLTGGSGTYHIGVYENISGSQYATALSADLEITITNEFGPYLYPNQYVNFTDSKTAIQQSEELAEDSDSDLDVVTNVYNYMISNFTYDYDKAASVTSGYLPDVDATLASKTGICFDYSALMATMLRVQSIPTRLEVGYVGDVYHAWISIYIKDIGWVNGIIQFDGTDWKMLDPTFASTSKNAKNFLPDNSDYLLKYVY